MLNVSTIHRIEGKTVTIATLLPPFNLDLAAAVATRFLLCVLNACVKPPYGTGVKVFRSDRKLFAPLPPTQTEVGEKQRCDIDDFDDFCAISPQFVNVERAIWQQLLFLLKTAN